MRRAAALAFIPLLAVAAVAGCGSSSSSHPAAASSASYKSVAVSGTFNTKPTVTIPKAKGRGDLYTKTLIQGTGAKVTSTDGVEGNYVAYDWAGTTSKLLGSSYTSGGSPSLFVRQPGPSLPATIASALVGQNLGSRVLAVVPPKDAFGPQGDPQAGIGGYDTLVFVIDMLSKFSTSGVPGTQASVDSTLPTVTAPAANSTAGPAIKIPANTAAPTTLQVKTLIKGNGAVVKKGQEIATQYTGVNWRTGKVFDSSWSRKSPLTMPIGEGQAIKGWDAGLVGQTVGSRVLLVIPPADGYGSAGNPQAGIKSTDTLVFVVDILAAV